MYDPGEKYCKLHEIPAGPEPHAGAQRPHSHYFIALCEALAVLFRRLTLRLTHWIKAIFW